MAKLLKMNRGTGELGGTDSLPHPGDFPLGSVESRAAARAMIRPDRPRAGDEGVTEDGRCYMWLTRVPDKPESGLMQLIFPWSPDGTWLFGR
jgi:hypothetical protein